VDIGPTFIVAANRDPAPDAGRLQKLQIVKGWIDESTTPHYRVVDVAGDPEPNVEVDLETGRVSMGGYSHLCTIWVDTDFEPAQSAYYYLRVVENPSLRWSWAQCVNRPRGERPADCENEAPKVIQEMAWSSPIWYVP
jgi:hypothetical protein